MATAIKAIPTLHGEITLQDYDKYSYPLRELGWDIDEIINPVLFS